MAELSNAEQFFRKITSPEYGYDFLASLPERKMAETDWLEFKGGGTIDDNAVAKHWSRALSGFANTSGGVLIWGIDARKDKDTGIDGAGELSLVPEPERFAQRLSDLLIDSVVAPVQGVQIRHFTQEGKNEGFVACLIPEGTVKAHRAEKDGRQFYIRISDKFVVPPVALISSLFHPKASAYLEPSLVVYPATGNSRLVFRFFLKNTGTLTARSISVILEHDEQFDFLPLRTQHTHEPIDVHARIPLSLRQPINPEMSTDAFFALQHSNPAVFQDGINFIMRTSCEDSPTQIWFCKLQFEQIQKNARIPFMAFARP